jgi:hypothetical protein
MENTTSKKSIVIEVWNMGISKLSSEICLWFNIKSKMHIKKVYK